jgi:dCTP deaminase
LILRDRSLHPLLPTVISPFNPERVRPASYDVALGPWLKIFKSGHHVVDPEISVEELMAPVMISRAAPYLIQPNEFILGATVERVSMPPDLVVKVEGRSTVGRLGLTAHITAGHVDPGFGTPQPGNITLEIKNEGPLVVMLRPGLVMAQLVFHRMDGSAARPYGSPALGSKYVGEAAQGVVAALGAKPPDSFPESVLDVYTRLRGGAVRRQGSGHVLVCPFCADHECMVYVARDGVEWEARRCGSFGDVERFEQLLLEADSADH